MKIKALVDVRKNRKGNINVRKRRKAKGMFKDLTKNQSMVNVVVKEVFCIMA